MPQTLTPEWEAQLGPDAGRHHVEWLHTLGNLTLTGYNPELSNRPYSEKRVMYALSHFELNRYFGTCEDWSSTEIQARAAKLFGTALQLWPRPPIAASVMPAAERTPPAGFHAECLRLVDGYLGIHVSKLSQTRYESGDGKVRLMCAVSAEHNESGGIPYYWFAFHKTQLDFLQQAATSWICLGCGSAETTLLLPLCEIQDCLERMSLSKTEDRQYWHVVVQKRLGRVVLRLRGGVDGPDLTDFNVGKTTRPATSP